MSELAKAKQVLVSAAGSLPADTDLQTVVEGLLASQGVSEAPNDGASYARKEEDWVALGSASSVDVGTGPDEVPTNSLLGAIPKVINFTSATGSVNIADTLPSMVVGDRVLVRKLNATQGTVTITCTGHTFTPENLPSLEVEKDGQFFIFEKVSSTRLDVVSFSDIKVRHDVTSNRVAGVTYTNQTGREISLYVYAQSATSGKTEMAILLGGVILTRGSVPGVVQGVGTQVELDATIPPGSTYAVNVLAGSIDRWTEVY